MLHVKSRTNCSVLCHWRWIYLSVLQRKLGSNVSKSFTNIGIPHVSRGLLNAAAVHTVRAWMSKELRKRHKQLNSNDATEHGNPVANDNKNMVVVGLAEVGKSSATVQPQEAPPRAKSGALSEGDTSLKGTQNGSKADFTAKQQIPHVTSSPVSPRKISVKVGTWLIY